MRTKPKPAAPAKKVKKLPPRGAARAAPSPDDVINRRIEHAKFLIDSGYSPQMVRKKLQAKFRLSPNQVALVINRTHALLAEDYEQLRPHFKMLQVHRMHKHIEVARVDHRVDVAIRGESELAKILGTRAPTKIEINPDAAYRDAIVKSLSGFGKQELARLAAEQLELEQEVERHRKSNGASHNEETRHA